MSNHQSPIIETSSSNNFLPIFLLLFALLGFGIFYMLFSSTEEKVPTAEPIVEAPAPVPSSHQDHPTKQSEIAPTASIAATKMNVFYIGVDNPLEVMVPGISSNILRVNILGGGGKLRKTGPTSWFVNVKEPTADCQVEVTAGEFTHTESFRVKRLPDPTARLGKKSDGAIGLNEFKVQQGLVAWLDNFDFDGKCQIQGFYLTKITKDGSREEVVNQGGRYTPESTQLVRTAKRGDTFLFTRVKAKCPGDPAARRINSLVFDLK